MLKRIGLSEDQIADPTADFQSKVRTESKDRSITASIVVICAFAADGECWQPISFRPRSRPWRPICTYQVLPSRRRSRFFPRDFCRRTTDCRTVVGPLRPANPGCGRALPLRVRHDLVRVRWRPCRPAGWQSHTGSRCLRGYRTFAGDCTRFVRWPGACQNHGSDNDRNRSRAWAFHHWSAARSIISWAGDRNLPLSQLSQSALCWRMQPLSVKPIGPPTVP